MSDRRTAPGKLCLDDPALAGLGRRVIVSAAAFLGAAVLTSIGDLVRAGWLVDVAIALMVLFLIVEFTSIPKIQRAIGCALAGGGIALGVKSGNGGDVLMTACAGSLHFLTLFGAVAFIQFPALRSPAMRHVRDIIVQQPPGRRYLALAASAHFLGALINFAALSLLSSFLNHPMDENARSRMAAAMTRGFAVAASWSPFFVSTSVIVAVLPQVHWLDFAVPGLGMGLIFLATGWLYDRLARRDDTAGRSIKATKPLDESRGAGVRLFVLASVLVAGMLIVSDVARVAMPVAIFLVVPAVSLVWTALIARARASHEPVVDAARLAHHLVGALAGLRSEILLFVGANTLGQGIAASVDMASIDAWLRGIGLTSGVAVVALLSGMTALTALGVHPVVVIVIIGHVLPPEQVGLRPESMALIMAAVWGLGVVVSPLSGLTLYMARTMRRSLIREAWGQHAAYTMLSVLAAAVFIVLYDQLTPRH